MTDTRFAWQVHSALEEWGAKADRKAAILLPLQGGALALAIAQDPRFRWPLVSAGPALAVAMGFAAMVIAPMLRPHHSDVRSDDVLFFGHLRRWDPIGLATRLSEVSADDETAMLSRQLVALSRINWCKYRFLQMSVTLTLVAAAIAAIVAVSGG